MATAQYEAWLSNHILNQNLSHCAAMTQYELPAAPAADEEAAAENTNGCSHAGHKQSLISGAH